MQHQNLVQAIHQVRAVIVVKKAIVALLKNIVVAQSQTQEYLVQSQVLLQAQEVKRITLIVTRTTQIVAVVQKQTQEVLVQNQVGQIVVIVVALVQTLIQVQAQVHMVEEQHQVQDQHIILEDTMEDTLIHLEVCFIDLVWPLG